MRISSVAKYLSIPPSEIRTKELPRSYNFRTAARPFDVQFFPEQPAGETVKRAIDLTGALLALIFFLPLMLLVALTVKATSPGPLIFAHRRLGKDGRDFYCLKFRSMVTNSAEVLARHLAANPEARAEWARDHKLRHDPRTTRLGQFLRRSSLDELPQLINVLRGEMSLVGPRPIVLDEVSKYGRYIIYYTSVTPGITGLWQISGRSDMSYRRRVAIDTSYARKRCLQLDLAIMLRTLPAVLQAKGAH